MCPPGADTRVGPYNVLCRGGPVCPPHHLVGKRAETALRDQRRIQIPHRSRRRVARILEQRLTRVFHLAVDPLERGTRQIHLAADLDPAGRAAFQRKRNRADRADVGGHIFAARPVASRRATHQRSVFIRERDAQAIDLELGYVRHVGRVRKDPPYIRRR